MQIDDPSRGFTWKADGPLDMACHTGLEPQTSRQGPRQASATHTCAPCLGQRMDTQAEAAGSTAAELLADSSVSSLATILRANSDFDKVRMRANPKPGPNPNPSPNPNPNPYPYPYQDDARALAAAVLAGGDRST